MYNIAIARKYKNTTKKYNVAGILKIPYAPIFTKTAILQLMAMRAENGKWQELVRNVSKKWGKAA